MPCLVSVSNCAKTFCEAIKSTVGRGVDESTFSTLLREALKPAITDLPRRVRPRERQSTYLNKIHRSISRRRAPARGPARARKGSIQYKLPPRNGAAPLETGAPHRPAPPAATDDRGAAPGLRGAAGRGAGRVHAAGERTAAVSSLLVPSTSWRNGSASDTKVTRSNRVSVTK